MAETDEREQKDIFILARTEPLYLHPQRGTSAYINIWSTLIASEHDSLNGLEKSPRHFNVTAYIYAADVS